MADTEQNIQNQEQPFDYEALLAELHNGPDGQDLFAEIKNDLNSEALLAEMRDISDDEDDREQEEGFMVDENTAEDLANDLERRLNLHVEKKLAPLSKVSDDIFDEIRAEADIEKNPDGDYRNIGYNTIDSEGVTHVNFQVVPLEKVEEYRQRLKQKYYADYRVKKRELMEKAFRQTDIDLNAVIPDIELNILISLITSKLREQRDRNKAIINRYIERALRRLIPSPLRIAYYKYKGCVKACPGFMYYTTEEKGESLKFWATPDMPYYFKQGTEMQTLIEDAYDFLEVIDKRVHIFYEKEARLAVVEVKMASEVLSSLPNGTYLDLVKHNAIWFNRLYNEIMGLRKAGKM